MNFITKNKTVRNYRLLNFICAAIYAWFYDFIFHYYISVLYTNHSYIVMDSSTQITYYLLTVFPILFFPGLRNIAGIFSTFVYVFAYIPFIETLSVCGYSSEYNDYRTVFFISMCLFFATDNWTLCKGIFLKKTKVSYDKFEKIVFAILLIVVVLNTRNLHLTNFVTSRQDMYDLRENLNVVGGQLVIYLIYWLKNILLPLVLICSLLIKRRLSTLIAFVGSILMYMIDQQKITFVAPFIIYGLYMIYRFRKSLITHYFHLFIMGTLIVIPAICFFLMYYSDSAYEISTIVIMRTQCIEGMELNTYFNWFGHSGIHPYTYYTHINIINALTGLYPYDTSLGQVVTNHGANANGMFWLMDGIAAGGLFGCIFIGFVFILMKSLFNAIQCKCSISLFAIFTLFAMSMTMNVSLFTSLFSCGLLLVYYIFTKVDFYMLRD